MDLKANFIKTQKSKHKLLKNVLKEQSRMIDEVNSALNSENPQAVFFRNIRI